MSGSFQNPPGLCQAAESLAQSLVAGLPDRVGPGSGHQPGLARGPGMATAWRGPPFGSQHRKLDSAQSPLSGLMPSGQRLFMKAPHAPLHWSGVGQSSQQKPPGAAYFPLCLRGAGRGVSGASLWNDPGLCALCESQHRPFLCSSDPVRFPLTRVIG